MAVATAVVYGPHAAEYVDRLRPKLVSAWDLRTHPPSGARAALAADMAAASALVSFSFDRSLPPAPRLKLIQIPAGGHDQIDLAAIPPGCTLCNVFGHEIGIAEYVLLALLEGCVRLRDMDAAFRRHEWRDGPVGRGRTHDEIFGKALGLVGFGHIGAAIAARARAFGVEVRTVTRTPSRAAGQVDWAGGLDRLDELLAGADFVVVCCPLTPETRGLIGAAQLARMKPTAVLVNVARGEIVDEDALYHALAARRIGGAVIDVWYRYPATGANVAAPSRFPFAKLDNVIMTPHASCWTEPLFERRWTTIADNLDRLATGRELRNVVSRAD